VFHRLKKKKENVVEQSTLNTLKTEENIEVKENVEEIREDPIKTSVEAIVEKEDTVTKQDTKEEKPTSTNQNQQSKQEETQQRAPVANIATSKSKLSGLFDSNDTSQTAKPKLTIPALQKKSFRWNGKRCHKEKRKKVSATLTKKEKKWKIWKN